MRWCYELPRSIVRIRTSAPKAVALGSGAHGAAAAWARLQHGMGFTRCAREEAERPATKRCGAGLRRALWFPAWLELQAIDPCTGAATTVATFALKTVPYAGDALRAAASTMRCIGCSRAPPLPRMVASWRHRATVDVPPRTTNDVGATQHWRLQVRLPVGADAVAPHVPLLPLLLSTVHVDSAFRPHSEPQWQLSCSLCVVFAPP